MEAELKAACERAGESSQAAAEAREARKETRISVSKGFARSVRDNVVAEFAAQAIRLGGIAVLARALDPSDFGILKALLAITLIAGMFMEGGIPDAIIQRQDLSHDQLCTAWWMSLAITAATVALVFLGAAHIASWMKMPELRAGIRLMCLPIFIEGTSMLGSARLQRGLKFGALALADVLAEVAFLVCSIALLLGGLPRWSLVGGLAARFAAHGLTVWLADAWIPVGSPRIRAARDLGPFALSVWGGRIVQAAASNSDSLLIARFLGGEPLAIYALARDLLRFVPNRLHKVAGRVTFSAFSRLQDDDEELARAYTRFFNSIARMVLPIIACMAVAAPDLVSTVYGRQWSAAALPLRLLALGLAFAGMNVASSSVYYAKNRPGMDIHLNGLRLVLVVLVVIVLRNTGLIGVTAGLSAVEIVNAVAAQYIGSWFSHFKPRELVRGSIPGVWLAVVSAILAALGGAVAHSCRAGAPLALLSAALPAMIVYLCLESSNLSQMLHEAFHGRRDVVQAARGSRT